MAKPAALAAKATWDTPASVLIAQSVLETGWGQHVRNGSYFGIKTGSRYKGKSATFATHEIERGRSVKCNDNFRAYDNFIEAADGYGQFLTTNPLFSGAFAFKDDPYKFLSYIAKHYATKPDYEQQVRSIIRHHQLLLLDQTSGNGTSRP